MGHATHEAQSRLLSPYQWTSISCMLDNNVEFEYLHIQSSLVLKMLNFYSSILKVLDYPHWSRDYISNIVIWNIVIPALKPSLIHSCLWRVHWWFTVLRHTHRRALQRLPIALLRYALITVFIHMWKRWSFSKHIGSTHNTIWMEFLG